MSTGPSRVTLDVKIMAQTPETLLLECRLKNASDQTLYVFDKLYRGILGNGLYWVDPNTVYVQLAEGKTAVVGKWIPEIPEGVSVEAPIVPLVTPLEAGKTLQELIQVALPLTSFDPYLPKPRGATGGRSENWTSLRLSIGYCDAVQLGRLEPQTAQTTRGAALRVPMSAAGQHLASATLHNVSLPVIPDAASLGPPRRCPQCGATNVGTHTACLICKAELGPPPLQRGRGASPGAAPGSTARCANPRCGNLLPPGSQFCPACGTAAPAALPDIPADLEFCQKCRHQLSPGVRFCPSCGTEVSHRPPPSHGAAGSHRCPNPQCGAAVPSGNAFCSVCGTRIG